MEETVGNPETVTIEEDQVTDKVFGSSDNFFEALEGNVNGVITDDSTEATQQAVGTEQVTRKESQPAPENVDWEKRYKDSSRAAIGMAQQLKNLKPFVPEEDHAKVLPFKSVILIIVLLNVALTCAIALGTFFFIFFLNTFFAFGFVFCSSFSALLILFFFVSTILIIKL